MGLKNYVCVSFYSDRAGVNKNIVIRGCWLFAVSGKASFDEIKEKMANAISNKRKEYIISPEDITITSINEISKRLYNRLKV